MPDALRDGLAWLTGRLLAHASEPVTYARGGVAVVVPAVLGKKLLRLTDESGVRVEWTDLDVLIAAADLDLGAGPVTPRRGDTVTVATAAGADVFEVMPFGPEPPWRWSDPFQTLLRIHCKQLDTRQFGG